MSQIKFEPGEIKEEAPAGTSGMEETLVNAGQLKVLKIRYEEDQGPLERRFQRYRAVPARSNPYSAEAETIAEAKAAFKAKAALYQTTWPDVPRRICLTTDEELFLIGFGNEVPKKVAEVPGFKKMSLQKDEGAAGGCDIKEEAPEAPAAEFKKKRTKSRHKNARSQDLRLRNKIKTTLDKLLEGTEYEVLVLRKEDKLPENIE